ncbi:MAG: ATP--guanido phosphotransferase [Lentisphaerae bacterium]|jgi:protein arginine kinase|nr:ATP--guanido phosphotransferase [Lentisphaerota bacterium]
MLQSSQSGVAGAAVIGGVQPRVILSSRVRLARNLKDEHFPDWATAEERKALLERLVPQVMWASEDAQARFFDMSTIAEREREVLKERWLVSSDLLKRSDGAGVVVAHGEALAVMINEEDHVRIQSIHQGLSLMQCWEEADALDTSLDPILPYAFSGRLGYLTACPSNVGTGMRASVMVHLPGLRLTGDIDPVIKALERLNLNVRGTSGEGSMAAGLRFQVSNQGTLGMSEQAVIETLEHVARKIEQQEIAARLRVLRDAPTVFEDCLCRSLAMLKSARLMRADEALDYLSAIRMGMEMGMVRGVGLSRLEELAMVVLPGHMQNFFDAELDPDERDERRANLLGESFAACEIESKLIHESALRLRTARRQ